MGKMKNEIETGNLWLVSYLVIKGYPITHLKTNADGFKTIFLQDKDGHIQESIKAFQENRAQVSPLEYSKTYKKLRFVVLAKQEDKND